MALLSRAEFARKCGVSNAYIAVNAKPDRGKVVLTEDGKVDDTHPINVMFYETRSKQVVGENSPDGTEQPLPSVKSRRKAQKQEFAPKPNPRVEERLQLENQKKQSEIEAAAVRMALDQAKLDKLAGKLIPTDVVKKFLVQHFKSLADAFKNGAEVMITEFGKRKSMDRVEIAQLRGALMKVIQDSVDSGITETKRHVSAIVSEHSQNKKAA